MPVLVTAGRLNGIVGGADVRRKRATTAIVKARRIRRARRAAQADAITEK